jgi:hypothetical protein
MSVGTISGVAEVLQNHGQQNHSKIQMRGNIVAQIKVLT